MNSLNTEKLILPKQGWQAGLKVTIDRHNERNRLAQSRHWGPLRVQRPFYPQGANGECHLYVLHPPGGMVTGDNLEIDVEVAGGAHALVTTPSAGKIYRGDNSVVPQCQTVTCRIRNHSFLEWLPQETILFDGARGESRVRVDLDPQSLCALWDIVCLGRPASNEIFSTGHLRQGLDVCRAGTPLYVENNHFVGGSDLMAAPWGLRGCPVSGTFLLTVSLTDEQLAGLRDSVPPAQGEFLALSDLDGLLVARYLGHSASRCRHLFTHLWKQIRPLMVGLEAQEPRIWNT